MCCYDYVVGSRLWQNKASQKVLVLLALGLPIAYPDTGVLGSFVVAIVVVLIARKHGSFRDMGFRQPDSWPKLLGTTLLGRLRGLDAEPRVRNRHGAP